MELTVQTNSFQTFTRFPTPAVAQTDCIRLCREEALVVLDPEISSPRTANMEICIITFVFE